MALTNAEKQKRWRDKRNALAKQALATPPPSKRNQNAAAKLEPLLEALFAEGLKNMATMSPVTVNHLAVRIERVLVEAGVVPESRRSKDSIAYAKVVKTKATRACRLLRDEGNSVT